MTPTQYNQALARLGLTPASKATATALGVSVRTSQRYASGETPIPLKIQIRFLELGTYKSELSRAIRQFLKDEKL